MHAEWRDGAIVVTSDRLPDALAVAPVSALALGAALVPTAGEWQRTAGTARFHPRFAPSPGAQLAVVTTLEPGASDWRVLARIRIPLGRSQPTTVVTAIRPGAPIVPENLLRFAVEFSAPMDEGSAAGRVHLVDGAGAEVEGALHPMPPELWDRARRRLTLLLEPGRIKRGLQPHEQAGPPLRHGEEVALVVDRDLRDAGGAPLVERASRIYRVGPPERRRIDPEAWTVTWPTRESSELVVEFDRPLDRLLVRRYLRVADASGRPVPGAAVLEEDSRRWRFTPDAPLDVSRVHVDARLEDLAGNSVRRVFDRDLRDRGDDGIDAAEVVLRR